MSENAGTIKYTVDVETAPLLKGESAAINSIKKVDSVMQKSAAVQAKSSMARSKASKAVTSSFRLQKGAAQQLGFQLQDVAVQAQMGISAFTILGQQGSQLAGVFGTGGALVGAAIAVGAALGGVLFKALSKTGDSVEELTEKLKKLVEVTTLSEAQAQVLISAEVKASTEKAKLIASNQEEIDSIKSRIALSRSTIKAYDSESETYKNLKKGQEGLNKELNFQIAAQQTLVGEIEKSSKAISMYSALIGDKATTATKDQADKLKELIEALKQEEAQLGKTEKEIALMMATELKATDAQKLAIATHFDSINAYKDKEEAIMATVRAHEAELRASENMAAQLNRERDTLTKAVSKTGLTPLQQLQLNQVAEIDLLRQGFEQKIILEQDFLTRSAELNKQHEEQVQSLQKKTADEASINWAMFENQAIGALASVATGAQTGSEAIQGLAKSILTQAIGALIKMGIQTIIGQTAVAASGVATAATLATAYATPAALVSLASFGANAAPAAAGIASTVALSHALSGAREHGGPVSAGSSYLVGERGPEIFTPTGGGGITSNKESFGGGTTLNVMIENNTPSNVSTQLSDDGKQLKVIINEVASQISRNQGVIPKAMRQSTDIKFKAR